MGKSFEKVMPLIEEIGVRLEHNPHDIARVGTSIIAGAISVLIIQGFPNDEIFKIIDKITRTLKEDVTGDFEIEVLEGKKDEK